MSIIIDKHFYYLKIIIDFNICCFLSYQFKNKLKNRKENILKISLKKRIFTNIKDRNI